MSQAAGIPDDVGATPESVEEYARAVAELPPDVVPTLLARVDAGIRHAERTGDLAPLRYLLDSIRMTAQLQRNPDYLAAVAEADAEDARGEHNLVDVVDFVAEMRAKYGS